MRINYVRLKNFIGIYNGTGKTDFEIDFKNNKNRIIMLIGENGSGKTTLLSTLHPFAETLDMRDAIILQGKDGYKEIHIEHNGKKYLIYHHYNNKNKKKSVKSYISIWQDGEWVELNDNGTVNSFKQIVQQELDVDEAFFRLSRIGSNVTNFIDLKPTERKKFISNFLPNIEEFLYYYKIVNDKWSDIRKDIKSVAESINKLDTEEHLESLRTNTENQIKNRKAKRERNLAKLNENKGAIKSIDPDGSIRTTHKELVDRHGDLTTELETLNDKLESLVESNPKFESYNTVDKTTRVIENVERKLEVFEANIKNLKSNGERANSDITTLNNDLSEKEIQLGKYKTDKNLNEYKDLKEKYTKRIKEIGKELKDYAHLEKYSHLTPEIVEHYLNIITNICNRISSVSTKYHLNEINKVLDSNNTIEQYKVMSEKINGKLKQLRIDLRGLEGKYNFYLGKQDQSEILEKRPSACKINSCAFIVEALKYGDADVKTAEYSQKTADKNEEIKDTEKKLDKTVTIVDTFRDINSIWKMVQENLSIIEKFPIVSEFVGFDTFKDFFRKDKNKFLDVTELNDFVYLKKELKEIKSITLPDIERNIELLESKAELINSLKNDIEKIANSLVTRQDELDGIMEELDMEMKKRKASEALLVKLNNYLKALEGVERVNNEFEDVKFKLGEISQDIKQISELNTWNKQIVEAVEDIDSELTPLEQELDQVKFNIEKLKEYTVKKDRLEKEFGNVDIVKNALSPTKGIPLLFIDIYLKQTKSIANRYLNIAYNGRFYIDNFELNEKDFLIRVKKEDGQLVDDISIASQGEVSLSSISLSMALMQQSLRQYNILLLDEPDGELDGQNRRAFVAILESLFSSMGVEQAFIISHNHEFDTYPVDLILMPQHGIDTSDKEYMKGKNVLVKF